MSTEIHSIPGPKVQPHFPNAVTKKLVIAKIACSEPVNPPQHRHSGRHVLQLVQPGLKRIGSGRSQVMNNLYSSYSPISENVSNETYHYREIIVYWKSSVRLSQRS